MSNEEKIKEQLEEKFGFLKDSLIIKRKGRIFSELPLGKFEQVFGYAVNSLGFSYLSAITALDLEDKMAVVYHLNRDGSIILNLRVWLNSDNKIATVTGFFPGADIFEREISDLFGIEVEGLAPGQRYPLADNWPKNDHPLRKKWKASASKEGGHHA